MMASDGSRASRRYIKLVNELLDERNRAHGAQTAVAKMLGVTQGYISKLEAGHRGSVGVDAVESAIRGLRLNPAYFFGQKEPRSYRDFLNHEPPFAEWQKFLETDLGRSVTDAERAVFRSIELDNHEPSVAFYQQVLLALRSLAPDDIAETVALNRAGAAEARRRTKPTDGNEHG